jgi:hypothetical protein
MPSPTSTETPKLFKTRFYHRVLRAFLLAGTVLGISLFIGILGYHFIAHLSWIDSLYNGSMILSGMGPAQQLDSDAGKIFASCYALFSGVVFISASGILLAPIFHRVLYRPLRLSLSLKFLDAH